MSWDFSVLPQEVKSAAEFAEWRRTEGKNGGWRRTGRGKNRGIETKLVIAEVWWRRNGDGKRKKRRGTFPFATQRPVALSFASNFIRSMTSLCKIPKENSLPFALFLIRSF